VWLSYNDPGWLAHRHGIDASSAAAIGAMTAMLANIAQKAATAPYRAERVVGVGHRSIGGWTVLTALTNEPWLASVLNPCHRDLIPCSIDLTRCSTDLIPCSVA
jgi:hypothetical protein